MKETVDNKIQIKFLFYSSIILMAVVLLVIHSNPGTAQTLNRGSKETGLLMKQQPDSTQVLAAIKRSREIHKMRPDEEEEYSYAQEAVNMALELKDTLLFARALDNMGLLYRFHQQYLQSLPLHIKAFELVKELPVPALYKMIFANNAGVAARYGEKYDLSVSYYLEALKMAENENNLKNIAIASNGLGNALGNIPNRGQEALKYFNRALKTEEQQENNRGIAMNLLSIGHYYINQQQFYQARKELSRLMILNRQIKDDYGIAITNEYFGISYLEEGKDFNKASQYFQKSLNGFTQLKDRQKQAELLAHLGSLSEHQQKKTEALSYYTRSQQLADTVSNKSLVMTNAMSLSELYNSQNNPSEALKNYIIAHRFKDSINLHNQVIRIAALTQNHELEKKEGEIELLEVEKKGRNEHILLQEEKIKQQQMIFLLAVFSLISILAIFGMHFRNTVAKRKTTQLLEEQEKEKLQAVYERNLAQAEMLASRMKINPHFLFNSLNAINNLIQQKDNAKASNYLIVFSRFVRMVLETSKKTTVTLTEELEIIRHYLILEENRFDNSFSFHIEQNNLPDADVILIPPLLLQPYVENAIWHGLMPSKKERKELTITVQQHKHGIEIIIEDNGVGRPKNKIYKPTNSHKSMGTEITQERIDLYNKSYDSQISCTIEDKIDENKMPAGTLVRLSLKNKTGIIAQRQTGNTDSELLVAN